MAQMCECEDRQRERGRNRKQPQDVNKKPFRSERNNQTNHANYEQTRMK